jgi:single-strand selective monofunctional uracil DNA glycosylase
MPRVLSPVTIARRLSRRVDEMTFAAPVTHVYNPLAYAWATHRQYLERYGRGPKEVVLVGMNPGPFGMAQTGVPFGDVTMARDWLEIEGKVTQPDVVHPKRPITGFSCTRKEVSGTRVWTWARDRFGSPEAFFSRFFIWNYCPLCFMEESGRNRTPDKLTPPERVMLYEACDEALSQLMYSLKPELVVGIGRFATDRIERIKDKPPVRVGVAPHPSPASPLANRGWAPIFEQALEGLGVRI